MDDCIRVIKNRALQKGHQKLSQVIDVTKNFRQMLMRKSTRHSLGLYCFTLS